MECYSKLKKSKTLAKFLYLFFWVKQCPMASTSPIVIEFDVIDCIWKTWTFGPSSLPIMWRPFGLLLIPLYIYYVCLLYWHIRHWWRRLLVSILLHQYFRYDLCIWSGLVLGYDGAIVDGSFAASSLLTLYWFIVWDTIFIAMIIWLRFCCNGFFEIGYLLHQSISSYSLFIFRVRHCDG